MFIIHILCDTRIHSAALTITKKGLLITKTSTLNTLLCIMQTFNRSNDAFAVHNTVHSLSISFFSCQFFFFRPMFAIPIWWHDTCAQMMGLNLTKMNRHTQIYDCFPLNSCWINWVGWTLYDWMKSLTLIECFPQLPHRKRIHVTCDKYIFDQIIRKTTNNGALFIRRHSMAIDFQSI